MCSRNAETRPVETVSGRGRNGLTMLTGGVPSRLDVAEGTGACSQLAVSIVPSGIPTGPLRGLAVVVPQQTAQPLLAEDSPLLGRRIDARLGQRSIAEPLVRTLSVVMLQEFRDQEPQVLPAQDDEVIQALDLKGLGGRGGFRRPRRNHAAGNRPRARSKEFMENDGSCVRFSATLRESSS